jgi:hypothetical protein
MDGFFFFFFFNFSIFNFRESQRRFLSEWDFVRVGTPGMGQSWPLIGPWDSDDALIFFVGDYGRARTA